MFWELPPTCSNNAGLIINAFRCRQVIISLHQSVWFGCLKNTDLFVKLLNFETMDNYKTIFFGKLVLYCQVKRCKAEKKTFHTIIWYPAWFHFVVYPIALLMFFYYALSNGDIRFLAIKLVPQVYIFLSNIDAHETRMTGQDVNTITILHYKTYFNTKSVKKVGILKLKKKRFDK